MFRKNRNVTQFEKSAYDKHILKWGITILHWHWKISSKGQEKVLKLHNNILRFWTLYLSLQDVLRAMRQNLAQILCRNRTKIRKAVGAALDKIICNYSSADQVTPLFYEWFWFWLLRRLSKKFFRYKFRAVNFDCNKCENKEEKN